MVRSIRQGDVYWLDFGPALGSAPAERRPCVVVQSDLFNDTRIPTTVVCIITSNLDRATAPGNVLLKKGEANLTKPSVVNISQVLTVDKNDLEDRTGRITPHAMERVIAGLKLLLEGLAI